MHISGSETWTRTRDTDLGILSVEWWRKLGTWKNHPENVQSEDVRAPRAESWGTPTVKGQKGEENSAQKTEEE